MERRKWRQAEEAAVAKFYPSTPTKVIAAAVGRSESAVYQLARRLGLKKSDAYFASAEAGRIDGTRGEACRFPKGHEPWNKGTSFTAGGRSAETRFKKGCMSGAAQHNYAPIGSTRLSKDGYLERKTNDEHPVPARRWVAVHRLVWEAAHGPIPPKYVVVFKPGSAPMSRTRSRWIASSASAKQTTCVATRCTATPKKSPALFSCAAP